MISLLDPSSELEKAAWLKPVVNLGFPHPKNEDFFYFPLGGVPQKFVSTLHNPSIDINFLVKKLPLNGDDLQLIVVDGQIHWENSSPELKELIQIREDFSVNSKEQLKQFHWDYFKAVSLLKREKIIHLTVRSNSPIQNRSIQIVTVQTQAETLCVPQFEISCEQETQSRFSIHITGPDLLKPTLHIPYFFFYLADASQLQMTQNIWTGKEQFVFPYIDVYQESHSCLSSWTSYLKGFKTRVALGSLLAGEQARVDMKGFYLASTQEQCEFNTRIYHTQPHTTSNQLFKGICNQGGHFSFNGDIVVSPHAQGVEAYQLSKNMMTDKNSKIFTRPQLHVAHHELQCTHGATIGGLNPEELLYLQSRGISLDQARTLAMTGFLDEVANTIPDLLLQKWAKEFFVQKLG